VTQKNGARRAERVIGTLSCDLPAPEMMYKIVTSVCAGEIEKRVPMTRSATANVGSEPRTSSRIPSHHWFVAVG
jgi:hypothetical protein